MCEQINTVRSQIQTGSGFFCSSDVKEIPNAFALTHQPGFAYYETFRGHNRDCFRNVDPGWPSYAHRGRLVVDQHRCSHPVHQNTDPLRPQLRAAKTCALQFVGHVALSSYRPLDVAWLPVAKQMNPVLTDVTWAQALGRAMKVPRKVFHRVDMDGCSSL